MTKQVDLVSEKYNPLINVKGLPSWPNEPKYEEIEQQQAYLLQEHHIDLESFWSNWSRVYEDKSWTSSSGSYSEERRRF